MVADEGAWQWPAPKDRGDRTGSEEEVTKPKRLLQQIDSDGEVIHNRLDTRVKNTTEGAQVSDN